MLSFAGLFEVKVGLGEFRWSFCRFARGLVDNGVGCGGRGVGAGGGGGGGGARHVGLVILVIAVEINPVVVGFPAVLLLVIMIEKLTRFDYRPLLNVRVRNGVGDHHPD